MSPNTHAPNAAPDPAGRVGERFALALREELDKLQGANRWLRGENEVLRQQVRDADRMGILAKCYGYRSALGKNHVEDGLCEQRECARCWRKRYEAVVAQLAELRSPRVGVREPVRDDEKPAWPFDAEDVRTLRLMARTQDSEYAGAGDALYLRQLSNRLAFALGLPVVNEYGDDDGT